MTASPATPDNDAAPDRILIVDDNPTNLQVLVRALDGEGHELLIARSGEEACRVAADARPSLVLLDIMMPPGIDGFETCRRLRADPATHDAVVIFISARDDLGARLEGFELGAVDFIEKPFRVEEVVARVETHLATAQRFRDMSTRYRALLDEQHDGHARPAQPIDALIAAGESDEVEFKSTIRRNLKSGKHDKAMELAWLKGVVAFMNTDGGTILIGVQDDGTVLGLGDDEFPNDDRLLLHVNNLIRQHVGLEYAPFLDFELHDVDGRSVLQLRCVRSEIPAFLRHGQDEDFYIRVGPGNRKLTSREVVSYLKARPEG